MFERLANSWELVRASAAVLRADKELVLFPVVSAVASILVAITFVVPLALSGTVDLATVDSQGVPAGGYALAFLFYLVQYFVIFFCNAALVGAALIRLRGGNPTVSDGFSVAFQRVGAILGYAVVAATVGLVLRSISERGGPLSRLVASVFGLAWSLATYLVVPVLVVEGVGPIDAVKRSAGYLRKTWGEQIAGNLGMGVVFSLLALATLAVGVGGIVVVSATESATLMVIVAGLLVLALVAIGLVASALSGIYAAAVYRYAAEGQAGSFFPAELVRNAFRSRTA